MKPSFEPRVKNAFCLNPLDRHSTCNSICRRQVAWHGYRLDMVATQLNGQCPNYDTNKPLNFDPYSDSTSAEVTGCNPLSLQQYPSVPLALNVTALPLRLAGLRCCIRYPYDPLRVRTPKPPLLNSTQRHTELLPDNAILYHYCAASNNFP